MSTLEMLWGTLAALLAVPVTTLLAQVMAAGRGYRPEADGATANRPPLAVLVPAHNEAAGIGPVVQCLVSQCGAGDRVLVVADNCDDDTAACATAAGAEVVVRHDPQRRGKGYALACGVDWLSRHSPPPVVVVVDADCWLAPGSLDALARDCLARSVPVQGLYLMNAPDGASVGQRLSAFAWRLRNQVRPRGGVRLGMPCQLMGSGMAFPWALLSQAPLASGNLVEDMQLGLDLAMAGQAPRFLESARIDSDFPRAGAAADRQRTRWEHGHMHTLLRQTGPLWRAAWRRRDLSVLGLWLDLSVPPLALLVLLLGLLMVGALALAVWLQVVWPVALASALFLGLMLAVGRAWRLAGTDLLSGADWAGLPAYVWRKLPLYARFFGRREQDWKRTDRN